MGHGGSDVRRELQKLDEAWLADRARELAEAGGQWEIRVQRAPEEPSPEKRARHRITHLPYQPWCAWCVMGKSRAKPHLQRPVESVKVPEFKMDLCYLLQDPKRGHEPGDQTWATTLVTAISTKSDENAYITAMCAAFVKRMAHARAVLKVDPEPALRSLADKIAVRASADGIQLKVEAAPRFTCQSIGSVGRAQDAVEGQIRCLRLELETRLSLDATPAMDVWPWCWIVKANKKTAPPSGKIRDGVRQGRADARFVRGIWLGKSTESDEHLFGNELGVYTTRTVKRVPDSERKTRKLGEKLAGNSVGQTCRTPGEKTSQDRSSSNARCDTSSSKEDRTSDVIRVPRAADTENDPRSSSSRLMETEDGGARDNTASDECPQAPVPAPSSPMEEADRTGGQQPVSSGVKRDARTAELPDEDEQGGKFLQVEGLTTVDAEEILCESSVEDDFMIDENTEAVNEEIVKAVVASKKKELDAMEAFGIFDVCDELSRDAMVITTRWENVPKGDKWRCRFEAREFRHDDPEMERLYTSGS